MTFTRLRKIFLGVIATFFLYLVGCSPSEKMQPPEISEEGNPQVVVKKSAAIIGGLPALQEQLVYPEEARKKGVETVLEANVLVNEQGKVEKISFDRETEYDFEEAAENALYRVEFTPGEENGEPVRMFVTIPVEFSLD